MRRVNPVSALLAAAAVLALTPAPTLAQTAGPAAWQNDLTPSPPKIGTATWLPIFSNAPASVAHPLKSMRLQK